MPTNNSAEFDYSENLHVNKYFMICSIPRSGSTLLCRGLWDTGLAGAPKEYFHHKHMEEFRDRWGFQDLAGYIENLKRFRTSTNGVFGFKIHYDQFDSVLKYSDIKQCFPAMHYILVKRRDHLRQAISLSKAVQSKQWSIGDHSVADPKYDPDDIRKRLEIIKQMEQDWEQFFRVREIEPYIVMYEDLAQKYPQVIKSVMIALGIEITETFEVPPSRLKKLSNAETEDWIKRFKSAEGNGLPQVLLRSDEKPRISVDMGCYNFEDYIAEAIESVLAQTLQPYELIITDDNSADKSWEIIDYYAKKYPDLIRAFRQPENIGMKRCGMFRKDLASGDLLSSIDGDDRWLPRKLELEWAAMQKNPEAKIAYSNVYIIDKSGKRTNIWYDGKGDPPPSGDVFVQTFSKRFFKDHRSVFRNQLMYLDVLKEIGYKDLDDRLIHNDWDKKIRMTAKYKVAYSGHALVEYRVHGKGIHNTKAEKIFESTNYVIQKNMNLINSRTSKEKQFIIENIKMTHFSGFSGNRCFHMRLP